MTTQENDLIYLNGISGVTGSYSVPPMTLEDFTAIVKARISSPAHLTDLQARQLQSQASFEIAPMYGDGSNLAKARWGIVFPAGADPARVDAILAALDPLISLRREQTKGEIKIYRGGDGARWITPADGSPARCESKSEWLARHGAGPGQVNPTIVPYYLLIVADPLSIPYTFQYELDVQYAVGRIYFQTLAEYARYAAGVAQAASGALRLPRRAVFFGVANPGDKATGLSSEYLVKPLARFVKEHPAAKDLGWQADLVDSADASKANLQALLGGAQAPAFLFTAGHGIDFPYLHPDQTRYQGGLVCQDWKGPGVEPCTRQHYLAAEDIPDENSLLGSVVFHFACFGAGTPYWDEYAVTRNANRKALAGRPFIAALPNRLLSLPGGGALAVIGHIDRAWNYSFQWKNLAQQTGAYEGILYQLMAGKPVGLALESMNDRYAEISTVLTNTLGDLKYPPYTPDLLARASYEFACNNDARGYAILGDPAVCIPAAPPPDPGMQRPVIQLGASRDGGQPVVFNPAAVAAMTADEQAAAERENRALGVPTGPLGENIPDNPPPPAPAGPPASPPQPPVQEVAQPTGMPAQPATPARPFSAPLDGLAFALQAYSSDEALAFSIDGVSYGLLDDAKEKIKQVVLGLNNALGNLAKKMEEVTGDLATLEVVSGVTDDLETFDPQTADRRILTRVSASGDIQVFLPRSGGQIAPDLLELHQGMVRQAMSNRLEVARALAEMIAGLFGGQKTP